MGKKWLVFSFILGLVLISAFTSFAATSHARQAVDLTPTSTPMLTPTPTVASVACTSDALKVWYNNGTSFQCFAGTGSINLGSNALAGVTEIDPGNNCGWVATDANASYQSAFNSYQALSHPQNTLMQITIQGQAATNSWCGGQTSQSVVTAPTQTQIATNAPVTARPAAIGIVPCTSSTVKIWYNNGANVECFAGFGYTGLSTSLSGVTEIDPGNNCGWVLGYISGSNTGLKYAIFDYQTNYAYPVYNTMTQIKITRVQCV